MATPTLTGLPLELLEEIVQQTMPEGFESLALTCRAIHEICTPFIERHNRLRSKFCRFQYRDRSPKSGSFWVQDPLWQPMRSSFNLLAHIAVEPIVSRYIVDANFERDFYSPGTTIPPLIPNIHDGGPLVELFANSPYLRQAGLDWKEYYALIVDDLAEHPHYSQSAAAFLLTLLPNIKTLTLPVLWNPLEKTKKLLDVIVRETKRMNSPWDTPSLAQVSTFTALTPPDSGPEFDLNNAVPFLALPHVRSFSSYGCVAMGNDSMALASKDPYLHYGATLENAEFWDCCIDDVAIANFVKHAPRLRKLTCAHWSSGNDDHRDWDIRKFVTVIEREAGNHLEELSVTMRDLKHSISPGKASMRGLKRLRKLKFPLAIAMCNVTDAESRVTAPNEDLANKELGKSGPFIGDLVPASVSELSLVSLGKDHHEKALEVMFSNFAAKKDSQLPALKEIYLSCLESADDAYKEQCAKLVAETEKAGVVLHLMDSLCDNYYIN
ncbi:F-box domain protein [Hypoxylon sp. FL0890]|nr:F-box domain protein [Hypoxylon sp. FL0890]